MGKQQSINQNTGTLLNWINSTTAFEVVGLCEYSDVHECTLSVLLQNRLYGTPTLSFLFFKDFEDVQSLRVVTITHCLNSD